MNTEHPLLPGFFKRRVYLILILCSVFVFGKNVFAQEGKRGQKLNAVYHDVIDMKKLLEEEKRNPPVQEGFKVPNQYRDEEGEEEGEEENGIPRDRVVPKGAKVIQENHSMNRGGAPSNNQILSPPPTNGFTALDDNISSIPPDVNGGVGPNHLMVTLNSQYRIQTRAGAAISTVSMATFWSGLGISSPFDPKTTYDPYNNRWISVGVSNSRSASSSLLVAVSQTNDPTGTWNRYKIDATGVDTMWLDYPSLGFNKDWIVISGNMFGNVSSGFQTCLVYALNKADFYAGGSGAYTVIDAGNDVFTPAPAITYDNTVNTVYLAESYNGNSGGSGYIRLFTLTGSVGSEVLSAGTFISTPNPWQWGTGTDFAPQLGSSNKIRCNDDRMLNCVYRNGNIWLAHSVFLPAGTPTRASIQWWKLTTGGSVTARDRIDDASGTYFYAFPSLSVNSNDDALMGYSIFSSSIYASAAYALKLNTDANFQSDYIFKAGLAKYYKTYSGTANRWGDYTMTQVDPLNDNDFWTLQEYAITPGSGYDRWGTWWANVTLGSPVADFTSDISTVCVNNPVVFSSTSTGSISSYSWNFGSGASPATSASSGPVSVQYSTSGLKTISLSVNGPGGSDAITKTNYINVLSVPGAAGAISGSTSVCQGQTGVVYSVAAISGATGYNWTLPSGASIVSGSNSNSITVNFSSLAQSGNVSVSGSNAACSGSPSSLAVTVNPQPTAMIQQVLTSASGITINDNTSASPYPGTISVSGMTGIIKDVNVFISNISHTYPDDIDMLLQSPTGQYVTIMSHCGGGTDLVNATLIFNDSASANLNDASANSTGTYKPTNYISPDNYPSPGPGSFSSPLGAVSTPLSTFNNFDPNGTWKLYIVDHAAADLGSVGSWSLQLLVEQQASTVSGSSVVCQGQNGVSYSIPVVSGATGYTWSLPSGASIAGGNNTASVTVNFSASAASGTITVTPFNTCGNYVTSNTYNVSVSPLPLISSLNPTSGLTGSNVQISGSNFTGATSVSFNGTSASFSITNDNLISATVPAGAGSGYVQVQNSCGAAASPTVFTVLPSTVDLDLKVYIQGFYTGSGNMRAVANPSGFPAVCDTFDVSLANSASPHAIAFTVKGVVGTNGQGTFTYPGAVQGNSYYIVLKHRNTLETWSSSALTFSGSTVSYDFSDLVSKSFGNNAVSLGDGNYAIWSGDVNQDGLINMADLTSVESSILSYLLGYYTQDLNGDYVVESSDYSLVENNIPFLLLVAKP